MAWGGGGVQGTSVGVQTGREDTCQSDGVKRVRLGRWGWDGSRQDSGDAVQYCLLPLVYDFPDCSGPSVGGTQGAKERDGDS